ncbi:MAG: HEAT repeat domain-containing protein [Chloroflexi bacterium]|nr:HEAT repeat domain-containing protein [Chloroflexota bacterium]
MQISGWDEEAPELSFRKPPISELTQALTKEQISASTVVPSTVVYGLSELTGDELKAVVPIWSRLSAVAKHRVLSALNEASEAMFELGFREIALLSLGDKSSLVRAKAIGLLWTDESAETMRKLMRMAESDPEATIRSRALESLGRFILLGEYGDIPADLAAQAQTLTYTIHKNMSEPVEIRRRALEALSNSSHAAVEQLILAAYADGNHELRIGALFAMGRTCNEIWRDRLLAELENDEYEYVYEAIRACGQIQIADSVQRIGEFALSEDQEIQLMAIWSLGEIGGRQAFEILARLEQELADEEVAAVLDEALDAAGFSLNSASLRLELDDEF